MHLKIDDDVNEARTRCLCNSMPQAAAAAAAIYRSSPLLPLVVARS
jgi:hypothetical protein